MKKNRKQGSLLLMRGQRWHVKQSPTEIMALGDLDGYVQLTDQIGEPFWVRPVAIDAVVPSTYRER